MTIIDDEGAARLAGDSDDALRASESPVVVAIDQDLCTGDGLCVQYAPEVFEFDVDGLAYVKDGGGELQTAAGSWVGVPQRMRLDVVDAARDCPGACIHVRVAED